MKFRSLFTIFAVSFSVLTVGCAQPSSGVLVPNSNIVYEVKNLPKGKKGWIRYQDLAVSDNGNLRIRDEGMVYPRKNLAEVNTEKHKHFYVLANQDGELHLYAPKENEDIVFFQGSENKHHLACHFSPAHDFHSMNVNIDELEEFVNGTGKESLVAKK